MERVKVSKLIVDFNLYPRCTVDNQHVRYMIESLKAGIEFPPIVIDEKSFRVIDGVHRVTAVKRHSGAAGQLIVVKKKYTSEQEMFTDAMRYNASHGRSLTQYDRAHCIIRSEELHIDPEVIASCLNITTEKLGELKSTRIGELHTYISGKGKTRKGVKRGIGKFKSTLIPLKRTIEHMAGQELTEAQVRANEKLSGMHPMFYINQLIILIRNDLLDFTDTKTLGALHTLCDLLGNAMETKTKKVG